MVTWQGSRERQNVLENTPHLRREAATPLGVRLLRVRLFYKILVANVGLLLLGAAAGLLVVRSLSPEISTSTAFLRFVLVAMLCGSHLSVIFFNAIGSRLLAGRGPQDPRI